MNIGIVGAEGAKFTSAMEQLACSIIYEIINNSPPDSVIVSGGCHLGGIDIWAEEIADELGIPKIIHLPKHHQWSGGYRERNLLIARDSDIVHSIVVAGYHSQYRGMRFKYCYHCKTDEHVKSGACYTMKHAIALGKIGQLYVIPVME